jgi:hypothetical protein
MLRQASVEELFGFSRDRGRQAMGSVQEVHDRIVMGIVCFRIQERCTLRLASNIVKIVGSGSLWSLREKKMSTLIESRTLTAEYLNASDTLTFPDLLPGFEFVVSRLFQ